MTTTPTGPRSFRATIVPPRCTFKSHVSCACEQPDTLEFDASDAVSKAEQRALFADYTAAAKGVKLARKRPTVPPSNRPNFTAAPFTANERHWLGREVGFRPGAGSNFAPVAGGKRVDSARTLRGTVWSLAPYAKAFWVYVAGQGFYVVREDDLLTGVNA